MVAGSSGKSCAEQKLCSSERRGPGGRGRLDGEMLYLIRCDGGRTSRLSSVPPLERCAPAGTAPERGPGAAAEVQDL